MNHPVVASALRAQSINIFSGSRELGGLGAALTNPTCLSRNKGSISRDYPVEFGVVVYPDAEGAFQAHRQSPKSVVAVPEADLDLMAGIIAVKLMQYPQLAIAVTCWGGVPWLETCYHRTGARTPAYQWWEGHGRESPMIRCLIGGYEQALLAIGQGQF